MRGQCIAKPDGFLSVAMHAPASGLGLGLGIGPTPGLFPGLGLSLGFGLALSPEPIEPLTETSIWKQNTVKIVTTTSRLDGSTRETATGMPQSGRPWTQTMMVAQAEQQQSGQVSAPRTGVAITKHRKNNER